VPAAAAAAVLVVLLGGLGAVVMTSPEVPRGTTVAGIDIGGRSRAEATAALTGGLAGRTVSPVPVAIAGRPASLSPKAAGLAVDVAATVEAAVQRAGLFTPLTGGGEVPPVVTVDMAKLDTALSTVEGAATTGLVRPAVRFSGLKPVPVYPRAGRGVRPDAAALALKDQWLRTQRVTLPVSDIDPQTSKADVDALVRDLAGPAVSASLTVRTPNGQFRVPPTAIAAVLRLESDAAGKITPRVDPARLAVILKSELAKVEKKPVDAAVRIKGGKPVVVPQVDGQAVDLAKLAAAMLPVLRSTGSRAVSAAMVTKAPALTTATATKLGITERVSTFTTRFTGGEDRNKNILLVADEVDGAIVQPGKTFSLNGYTGPRGREQGYIEAPVIVGGKIKNEVGGGISQFATTLFNAIWYSGLEDVSHQPHGYYISRYPAVVEATVYYPTLDLKFRNDGQSAILIDTAYTSSSITVTFWGTKRYDVRTEYGPKTDVTQPTTQTLRETDCNETAGIPGFAQTAFRVFRSGSTEVKRERYSWRYKAEPKFICAPLTAGPGASASPAAR
jgi:vancomycin resistance protein YoaR